MQVHSQDDLSLLRNGNNVYQETTPRARSSSPIKNRRSMPPNAFDLKLPTVPYTNKIDANLTQEQLRMLSKSPMSKKLHITSYTPSSKYVIPVPLTLHLPPKLSPKNVENLRSVSPDGTSRPRSKSPQKHRTRLVYTSTGYSKMNSSSDEDEDNDASYTEEQLIKRIALPRRPLVRQSPPPVVTNNTKVSKIVAKSNYNAHDELSIIEEMSNAGSSRAASLSSEKTLPPLPPSKVDNIVSSTTPVPPQIIKPSVSNLTKSPAYTNIKIIPQPIAPSQQLNSSPTSKRKPPPPLILQKPVEAPSIEVSCIPRIPTEENLRIAQRSNAPAPIESKEVHLKINKRSFSDESQVSSASSFSSVGDFMNFARFSSQLKRNSAASPTPDKRLEIYHQKPSISTVMEDKRITSGASEVSAASNDSWESIQESIDLSISEYSIASSKRKEKKEQTKDKSIMARLQAADVDDEEEEEEETEEEGTVSESNENEDTDEDQLDNEPLTPITPLIEISKEATKVVQESLQPTNSTRINDKDNGGLGRRFNFPNNLLNVTNSPEVKNRAGSLRSEKSKFSFYSSNGQIEIPDFTNQSVSDTFSSKKSVASTTFDEVSNGSSAPTEYNASETEHALTNSKPNYNNPGFNNFYGDARLSKSTPWSLSESGHSDQSTGNRSRTGSPVRHTRHKSMHNIDFSDLMESQSMHSKSPSVDMLNNRMVAPSMPMPEAYTQPKPTQPQQEEEALEIQIEEPPSQVRYAIDFKDATSHEDSHFNDLNTRISSYNYDVESISGAVKALQIAHKDQPVRPTSPSPSVISDTESVVIDLTDDQYDICMINRNNSTTSYRSVTEKTKDGKEIEVVLVDDEGEDDEDLMSIYSKYRNNSFVFRKASTSSTTSSVASRSSGTSDFSSASFDSIASSQQLKVMPSSHLINKLRKDHIRGTVVEDLNKKRGQGSVYSITSSNSASYTSRRIKPPVSIAKQTSIPHLNPPVPTKASPQVTSVPTIIVTERAQIPKTYSFTQGQTFLN
ncbi:hypothetical protein DFJ63DRAFT_5008 [Scheffersomyces coipomensis]|uniref:uncharacterized protein n=1 Tax=Scheffersomyces coipomensis TaxID=1788519 RepID=UPI00315DC4B3